METSSKVIKFIIFIVSNLMLFILLYNIPIDSGILSNICVFKFITGHTCWNCGMTRAFLSILHCNFSSAYFFNNKVVFVFPFTICIYLYSWVKFIFSKGDVNYDRKR